MKKPILFAAGLGSAVLSVVAAQAQQKAGPPPPEANYWMSAETVSGMATGRPNGSARNLMLQLGSARRAAGAPSAEHLPPTGLQAGPSLPLTTPAGVASGTATPSPRYDPSQIKGRMLIYWGCGEQARPGQPLVVDMAALAGGKASPLAAMFNFPVMNPPAPGRHATYGEWPNSKGRTSVPAAGSLVGDHVVRGNYSPEIRFALAGQNDFLAPLLPKSSALPSGAMRVAWPAVPNALAYAAGVVGSGGDGTMVMWSSSEVKIAGAAVPDYVAQGEITRLVQQKALMAPTTTECKVPAEVVKATQGAMLQMAAYGPEANLAAPRTDPHRWTVKLRTKSTHMAMLGVEMPDMGGGDDDDGRAEGQANAPSPAGQKAGRKRGLLKGLGPVLGGIR